MPLDLVALDRLRNDLGDAEALREVVQSYLEEAPQLLAAVAAAVETRDARALQRAAHTLKSASASLGAADLSALCLDLETRARQGNLDGCAALAARAAEGWPALAAALAVAAPEGSP